MIKRIFSLLLLLPLLLGVQSAWASAHGSAHEIYPLAESQMSNDPERNKFLNQGSVQNPAVLPGTILSSSSNCAAKASSLAASYGNAQVMSVTQNGNSCTIVIRVKDSSGGPARIIKKTVSG